MTESKIDATDRLRAEGRWEEASAFKDKVKKQLRAEGKSRAEAGDLAWEAMKNKYPPPDPFGDGDPEADGEMLDVDELIERFQDNPPNLVRDALWAYENLANTRATPKDSPSLGAWALLKWARQAPGRFFERIFSKVMSTKEYLDEESHDGIPDRSQQVLAEYLERHKGELKGTGIGATREAGD